MSSSSIARIRRAAVSSPTCSNNGVLGADKLAARPLPWPHQALQMSRLVLSVYRSIPGPGLTEQLQTLGKASYDAPCKHVQP